MQAFVGTAICKIISAKGKKPLVVISFLAGTTFLYTIWTIVSIYLPVIPSNLIFFVFLIPLYTFLFIKRAGTNKNVINIVFFSFLLYSIGLLSHILKSLVYYTIFREPTIFDFVTSQAMYASLIGTCIAMLFYTSFIIVWDRNVGNHHLNIPNIGAFTVIMGGQLTYAISHYLIILDQGVVFNALATSGVMAMLIGNIAILQILITNSKKEEAENELQKTRHATELEQSYYREVEKRREELTKIRHDFNNQLTAIGRLINVGEENSAKDMIKTLSDEIMGTRENPYCNIPVVNAILLDKMQLCEQSGITLSVELDLPANLSVEQMHLCSIFSNLLDNAINACKQQKHIQAPTIQLNSMVDGDYLFIKSTNPSNEPPKKPLSGRGYGSKILSDLSARYGGSYRTEYKNNAFTAVVSLLAVGDNTQ